MLASAQTFPHRPDTATTVGAALLAASTGLGHRRVAHQLSLPATTVRGWIRRAHASADEIWSTATRRALELDPTADPSTPGCHPLVAAVSAVGQAIAAHFLRLGPVNEPWNVAVLITGGRLLAPPPAAADAALPHDSS